MPVDMAALAADLAAESAVTRALIVGLDEPGWHTPTPAAGWDIADQIGHLAFFDEVAASSAPSWPRRRRPGASIPPSSPPATATAPAPSCWPGSRTPVPRCSGRSQTLTPRHGCPGSGPL